MDLFLDIDDILKDGCFINNYEFEMVEFFICYFNWNIGYGKKHGNDTLNEIKEKYNLNYEEICIVYKGSTYKVKFSEKTNNHGMVKGYKLINDGDKSSERINNDEYFILINLDDVERNFNIGDLLNIPVGRKTINSHLINRDFIKYRSFNIEFLLVYFVWRYFVFKQDGFDDLFTSYNDLLLIKYGLILKVKMNNIDNKDLSVDIIYITKEGLEVKDMVVLKKVMKELYILIMDNLLKYDIILSMDYFNKRIISLTRVYIDTDNSFNGFKFIEGSIKLNLNV